MLARIAHIRRVACQHCPHPCDDYQAGKINHDDPEAACPVLWSGQWHIYLGEGGAAPPAIVSPVLGHRSVTWEELHRRYLHHDGSDDSEWLMGYFSPNVPHLGCSCLRNWLDLLKTNPPRWDDAFAWSVQVHNAVSQRIELEKGLKRPSMTVAQALQRWSDPA